MNSNAFAFRKALPPEAKMPRHQGLDWQAIRRDYEARATPEELDGPFDAAGNLKDGRQARGGAAHNAGPPRTLDYDKIARLFKNGHSIRAIAREVGGSDQGVNNALRSMKLK